VRDWGIGTLELVHGRIKTTLILRTSLLKTRLVAVWGLIFWRVVVKLVVGLHKVTLELLSPPPE